MPSFPCTLRQCHGLNIDEAAGALFELHASMTSPTGQRAADPEQCADDVDLAERYRDVQSRSAVRLAAVLEVRFLVTILEILHEDIRAA